jgi:SagB-type dehydrogenase family enzyme
MKKKIALFTLVGLLALSGCSSSLTPSEYPQPSTPFTPPVLSSPVGPPSGAPEGASAEAIALPEPVLKGQYSLEECLKKRRSVRAYSQAYLTLAEVSQLLWAAQGRTDGSGGRSVPSAGALYPLEVYLAAARVENLAAGVYRYRPADHSLLLVRQGNRMDELAAAALNQPAIKNAAVSLVIAAVYERTTQKYGERGNRYAILEAGHAAQNFCLQAVALDLGAVTIGAFEDERVKSAVALGSSESPLYILPAGHPD